MNPEDRAADDRKNVWIDPVATVVLAITLPLLALAIIVADSVSRAVEWTVRRVQWIRDAWRWARR